MNIDGITKLLDGRFKVCVTTQNCTDTRYTNSLEEAIKLYQDNHEALNFVKNKKPNLFLEEEIKQVILRQTNHY